MFKKPLTYWIIVILMFAVYLFVEYNSLKLGKEPDDFAFLYLLAIPGLFAFLVIGGVLGALIALIPFKGRKYSKKFAYTFPVFVAIITWLMILMPNKMSSDPIILERYSDIQIPPIVNCSSVHDGQFETKTLIIDRQGENQTQTHKKDHTTDSFKVKWLSDCEYYLISKTDTTDILKVKIISVNPRGGYECYIASDSMATRVELKKIIKKG